MLKISRLTAIWAPSGRFEPIWSDQLLAAAVIEPLGAVRASADATSGFSDVKLAQNKLEMGTAGQRAWCWR